MQRGFGLLVNISSLHGPYSIGQFGDELTSICLTIKKLGGRWIQTLPITSIGVFNSPYDGHSGYAGNYLYINPKWLIEQFPELNININQDYFNGQEFRVDYKRSREFKKQIILDAYLQLENVLDPILEEYIKNKSWVNDYALFMTIKNIEKEKPWWEWRKVYKIRDKISLGEIKREYKNLYYSYIFEQYVFDKQWQKQLEIIHSLGVRIIGDMPYYISKDSVEAWSNPEMFKIDSNLNFTKQAGVPPDFFSKTGQLWGNPIYDIKAMKKNNYSWWMSRIDRMLELYDRVRIDHFRAFDRYWEVDINAGTALEGEWKLGPGKEFFDTLFKKHSKSRFIAEDLGMIDKGVEQLLEYTGFPGMKILQFAFNDFDSTHLPHNTGLNSVVYTATHDNDTTLGWLYSLDENIRDYTFRYLSISKDNWQEGGYNSNSVKGICKAAISSSANLAIIPYQDICGYGSDTRMNVPGVADKNWEFRLTEDSINKIDSRFFFECNCLYGRNIDIVDE